MARDLTHDIDGGGELELAYETKAAELKALLGSPEAGKIRTFRAGGCPLRATGTKLLAQSRELTGVVTLDLTDSHLDDACLEMLARSDNLRSVEQLAVGSVRFGLAGIRALFATGAFPRLRSLSIHSGELGGLGIDLLLDSEIAPRLQSLDVGSCRLGDAQIRRIADAPSLARLRTLTLRANRFGANGAGALAQSATLGSLVRLDLGHNRLLQAGIAALAASERFAKLERLELRGTQAHVPTLAASRAFRGVRDLGLSANGIDALDLGSAFPALERLDLNWNHLTPRTARDLQRVEGLRELILSETLSDDDEGGLGDEGAAILAGASNLASLRKLDLRGTQIRERGAQALAASSHLERLEWLDVTWNVISPAGVAALVERFGERVHIGGQREDPKLAPQPPAPPPPAPSPARRRKPKPLDRARVLARLAKKRAFSAWRPGTDAPIIAAAETIARDAVEALAALTEPTRAAERRILKRYVTRFAALDRKDHFIGTIEVEDIGERFEAMRSVTSLSTDDDEGLFDTLRDF